MRRITLFLMLAGAVSVLSATSAEANMTGTFSRAYGTTNGGAFLFTPSGNFRGLTFDPFVTFCLERNEYLDYTHVFTVEDISGAAYGGGRGGGSPDPLNERTAWLYESFRNGSLAAFGFDYNNAMGKLNASSDALQYVIWGLEDELGSNWAPSGALQTAFFNAANTYGVGHGLGSVRVLNLTWPNGTPAQSQLVVVPLPAGVLLGMVGLGAFGLVRRRLA
ncbi:MAG: VPLPA-CTERM sorting domain-containing protein [Phycisphaerae bacterium]|nr:VPLPA-CTERM sorting domain-containing protein [Phycisphaerae bacterium]